MHSEQDYTMSFEPGSVTFSVEDVLFRIPKAFLQLHSDAFSGMLEHKGDPDEPVVLQDSVDAFREFRKVIFTPFESCISPSDPSSSNLGIVLKVLTIAHKYCAPSIEQRAHEIAIKLTHPDIIRRHIAPTLSAFNIMEVATTLGCDEMSASARTVILEDLSANKICRFDVLEFGERVRDREIVGKAYYKIMRLGRHRWNAEPRLTDAHRRNLTSGLIRCYEEWDKIVQSFDTPEQFIPHEPHACCDFDDDYVEDILRTIATSRIPSYDVLDKLFEIISLEHRSESCDRRIRAALHSHVDRVTDRLYEFFTLPAGWF